MQRVPVQRRSRFPRTVVTLAVVLLTVAMLWWALVVPALVKYPNDLDVTARYEGAFTLFVDPATAAPLATPVHAPLQIERQIRSVPDAGGASLAVVEETIIQTAGDLVHATQRNVYVMDRRTLQNVADDRAYAFDPTNVVDRTGSYRLNLPFDTSSESTYAIYKNEIGSTYEMRADTATPTTDEAGLRLHNFTGSAIEAPLDDAYLVELGKIVPLPTSMTVEQLKPHLLAAGLDVDGVLAAIGPRLTAADLATLSQLAAEPIPLQYVLTFEGTAGVETTTGAEVDVRAAESVGVKPALGNVAALREVLSHYPAVPEAVEAVEAVTTLREAPAIKLFEYSYEQTPASVADIAGEVTSMRNQIRLAERYVPLALVALAGLCIVAGAAVSSRQRALDLRPALTADKRGLGRGPVARGHAR